MAAALVQFQTAFSPHTRGCSAVMKLVKEGKHVFPAYAGMFLPYVGAHNGHYGFPRIRGDVPCIK